MRYLLSIFARLFPKVNSKDDTTFSILKNFEGLFEVLYKAANCKTPEKVMVHILKDWDLRINTFGDENLKKKWKSLLNKYLSTDIPSSIGNSSDVKLRNIFEKWYKYIIKMGAVRDIRDSFTIDNSSSQYYAFEEAYNLGDTARVSIPCWTYKGNKIILQKGSASVL